MSEIDPVRAMDGAQLVKAERISTMTYFQVWHGGTTVNVYCTKTGYEDTWEEVDCWTLMDEKGRPCERSEISAHMCMNFETMREEMR